MTTLDAYLDFVADDTGTRPTTVWEICGRCGGDGTLGGWPGAYTESDRAEWSDEDYESYFTTRRGCEDCDGTGKVRTLPEDSPAFEGWCEWCREEADDRAIRRAESGYSW